VSIVVESSVVGLALVALNLFTSFPIERSCKGFFYSSFAGVWTFIIFPAILGVLLIL